MCGDSIAKQLGMDALELRLKNTTRVGADWWFPYPVKSTYLNECLEQCAESIGWKEKEAKADGHDSSRCRHRLRHTRQ